MLQIQLAGPSGSLLTMDWQLGNLYGAQLDPLYVGYSYVVWSVVRGMAVAPQPIPDTWTGFWESIPWDGISLSQPWYMREGLILPLMCQTLVTPPSQGRPSPLWGLDRRWEGGGSESRGGREIWDEYVKWKVIFKKIWNKIFFDNSGII